MTTTTQVPTVRQLHHRRIDLGIADAHRNITFQRGALALARKMDLTLEAERALRNIDEWYAEIDSLMDEAAEAELARRISADV